MSQESVENQGRQVRNNYGFIQTSLPGHKETVGKATGSKPKKQYHVGRAFFSVCAASFLVVKETSGCTVMIQFVSSAWKLRLR